jgi:hypothetical protein
MLLASKECRITFLVALCSYEPFSRPEACLVLLAILGYKSSFAAEKYG